MQAEIIAIGTEIMLGSLANSNTPYLSRKLAEIGLDVLRHTDIADDSAQIRNVIQEALKRAAVVITIGGLGPTEDDITVKNIAQAVNRKLVFNVKVSRWIEDYFKKQNLKCPKINFKQAFIPEGAVCLKNKFGTAAGLIIKLGSAGFLIALPGPPQELQPMFENAVMPFLKRKNKKKSVIISRTIKTTGCQESFIGGKIKDLLRLTGDVFLGSYPQTHEVDLKITAKANSKEAAVKKIDKISAVIKKRLKNIIFGADEETIEGVVGKLLASRKKTIAAAESCTGGLLTSRLTDIPGSSKYFIGGIIAYSNSEKMHLLKVKKETLRKYGAVSAQTAGEMAGNLLAVCAVDYAVSITGIAGPGGSTKNKPVGLVYISLADKNGLQTKKFLFLGSRKMIKLQASEAALDMVRKTLLSKNTFREKLL